MLNSIFAVFLFLERVKKKNMDNKVDTTLEKEQDIQLYMVDWLKVVVDVKHNPDSLNNGLRFDVAKSGSSYSEAMKSYKGMWVTDPSYDNRLKVKSMKNGSLLVEGNLGKWLTGHNVTGSDNVVALVYDTVIKLADLNEHITPTKEQLDGILMGYFKVHEIDINKAILFNNKNDSLQYLERLKFHSSYPRFEKTTKANGVYFGYDSMRKTIKYYHKGREILANSKYQHSIDKDLKALASKMIRCEMRLKWRELNDKELLNGYNWNAETVKYLIDKAHEQLRLPKLIEFPNGLPTKYKRFISCYKAGTLVEGYTKLTIDRMKRDLMRLYGVDLHNMQF